MRRFLAILVVAIVSSGLMACSRQEAPKVATPDWEVANPIAALPAPPLGVNASLADLKEPPTPERMRLGRWLFYDTRLSADNTIACSTCHNPEQGFSETESVSTGIKGQKGGRKAPSFVNAAFAPTPYFFWDGRADSLEAQALGPIANPIEMGNTHLAMVRTLEGIAPYKSYFKEAFGSEEITKERVAKAIADYERTCFSGDSAWDRWKKGDENAVSAEVKKGDALFFGKAGCSRCHSGPLFTDGLFHNAGVGWDPAKKAYKDEGRFAVTKAEPDKGKFKTPTLRDASRHSPFLHDGSIEELTEVVALYAKGGTPNPYLDPLLKPVQLKKDEIEAIAEFIDALKGGNAAQKPPAAFPK